MKNTFTHKDLEEAREHEAYRYYVILNYLLNKNSHSISEGGVDYEKIFNEIQDFESFLLRESNKGCC